MPKYATPPEVAPESWRELVRAASLFSEAKPWKYTYDSQIVGLTDRITGETRVGSVLGNAGLIFGALFHRRATGLNWIFRALAEDEFENMSPAEGIDCVKVEWVPKRELAKQEIERLRMAGFKPVGRGAVWPQFRSAEPGWHPWFINQTEAGQLIDDLPRLLAFCHLVRAHPDLFDEHLPGDVPFLPVPLPDRPLRKCDLNWRPVVIPPDPGMQRFHPSKEEFEKLLALPRASGLKLEFNSTLMPGASFLEGGRPCCGRLNMLLEQDRGGVVHVEFHSGAMAPGESACRGLVKGLLKAGVRPENIFIAGTRLQPLLEPICDAIGIELRAVRMLPAFEEAFASLQKHMRKAQT